MPSCAAVNATTPSATEGQTKWPFSSRLAYRHSPLAVPPQHLEQSAPPATEHEYLAAEGIVAQLLLHQRGQAVEALAHVRRPAGKPDPVT